MELHELGGPLDRGKRRLRRLEMKRIDRVSLVDKGDNPEAHVLILKRWDEKGETTMAEETARAVAQRVLKREATELRESFAKIGQPITYEVAESRVLAENPELYDLLEGPWSDEPVAKALELVREYANRNTTERVEKMAAIVKRGA